MAPGGQLPLTWPRHTGPPRAPTRGSRGWNCVCVGALLAAFSIREARGWKFELVADCTSIDPARRDYFFLSLSLSLFFLFWLCVGVGVCARADRPRGRGFSSRTPDHRFRLRRTDTAPVWILSDESMTRVGVLAMPVELSRLLAEISNWRRCVIVRYLFNKNMYCNFVLRL